MFKQLSPLLSTRSLVITATLVEADRIRLTVTPRSTGKDGPPELSQPFAVEGTAEELDNDLPAAIAGYTTEHLILARSLEVIKSNMDAALKAAKADADRRIAEAKKTSKPGTPSKPVEATPPPPPKPAEPSLFDPLVETTAEPGAPQSNSGLPLSMAAVTAMPQRGMFDTLNEEEEILKEVFDGAQDNLIAA